jgi:hypothetical protein
MSTVFYPMGGIKENEGMDNLAQFSPGVTPGPLSPGQIGGIVVDSMGAVISNAQVQVTSLVNGAATTAITDSSGRWVVTAGMPSGRVKISATAQGFQTAQINAHNDANRPQQYSIALQVGAATETVEVTAEAPTVETSVTRTRRKDKDRDEKKAEERAQSIPSANVLDLQKRVAGVLPVRVDVPRAGNSYRFARALVLDEETKVTFNYKTSKR